MTVLNLADAYRVGTTAVDRIYVGTDLVWEAEVDIDPIATLTIAAATVASDLTDFVTRVDLADLPAGWWNAVATDGSDIRVKQDSTDLPFDLAWFDHDRQAGELFFKADLLASSDNVFTVEVVEDATAPAVTDPNGRNAVWSDYDAMFAFPDMTNRNGSGADATTVGTVADIGPLSRTGPFTSHQGLAIDTAGNFYLIDTDKLYKYDASWNLVASNTTALSDASLSGTNHFGDGTVVGGELYVPLETYPSGPYVNQHITVWNLADLSFNRSYDVSVAGHETSGLCFNPDDDCWYMTGYHSGDAGYLYKYDDAFQYLGTVALSSSVEGKQSIAYRGGEFYLASDSTTDRLYRVSIDGSTVTEIFQGQLVAGGYVEGLDFAPNGDLYVQFNNSSGTSNHIFRFGPGLGAARTGHVKATGLPKRTTWTLGISAVACAVSGSHQTFMGYSEDSISESTRAGIVGRCTSPFNFGVWNNSDSWLYDSGSSTTTEQGARHRWNYTHNGTTSRKIWRDGALGATDSGAAQRPGGAGDTITIGAEDASASERFAGWLNYAYLRNGELSADWLAAEAESWETPSVFYAVT